MLFGRGYHTLVLILTVVMLGVGALTFTYARERTRKGLILVACFGLIALRVQGYLTLFLVILGAAFGIGALVFLYYDRQDLWHWWFPDQPFDPTIKRWLRYLAQALTAALAYGQVRAYINLLTGVDPGNFPTALTALTALNILVWWLVVIPIVILLWLSLSALPAVYAGLMVIARAWRKKDQAESPDRPVDGLKRRFWGALGIFFLCWIGFLALVENSPVQQALRIIASNVLVAAEFSYDRTCAISTKHRLVAQLKERRGIATQVSRFSIAKQGSAVWLIFHHFTFSTGICDNPGMILDSTSYLTGRKCMTSHPREKPPQHFVEHCRV